MNSASVDLIYLDPPFNSNKNYSNPIGEGQEAGFKDIWTLDDVDLAWHGEVAEREPALYAVIDSAGLAHGSSMKAYLIMMSVRLLEMRRLLKETGSIYLHCDPTASHYLKMVMDCVFGSGQFQNEIAWCYAPSGRAPKYGFHRKHDTILYYTNGSPQGFHHQYTEMDDRTLRTYNKVDDDGRRYKDAPGGRSYLDQQRGRPVPSWWADIPSFGTATNAPERIGYPTQKPLKLLKRIIAASSSEGDVVLDPFCGCATACVAAEELGREWIGIDVSPVAATLVKDRLKEELGLFYTGVHRTDIPHRSDLGNLPPYNADSNKRWLFGQQEGRCNGCREMFPYKNFTVDHVVPQSKGGQGNLANLQLLCGWCNSKKGARSQEAFLAELAALGLRRG